MAQLPLTEKLEVVRRLHDVHEHPTLADDEDLIQLQHDLDELLATGSVLLNRDP